MNVYLVNETTSSSNWGCRGTTTALRRLVERHGGTVADTLSLHDIHAQPPVLSRLPGVSEDVARFVSRVGGFEERALGVLNLVPGASRRETWTRYETVRSRWDPLPLRFEQYEPAARRVLDGEFFTGVRESIRESDLVLINGEGSIYDRRRKGRALLFIAYLAAEHLGRPVALVNHTADVHDPVVHEIAANVYPLLDDVVCREPRSARRCARFLPDPPEAYLGADAAFTYEPIDDQTAWRTVAGREGYFDIWPDSAAGFDPTEPYVCVGGSSIYNRPDRPGFDPVPGFARLCERLERRIGPVVLTASCRSDAEILRPVAETHSLPLFGPRTPVQQAVDVLGNAAAYVGGRWHPSVYAATGGTPAVTLTANTDKTAGLVELLGLDAPTFDALALEDEIDDIVAVTREYVERGSELRSAVSARASELAIDAEENVRALRTDRELPLTTV